MIRICTSHRTEELIQALVANLTDERTRQGPFAPARVIVPNRNVETYLRLELCRRLGIAINLETVFLRRFLASIAETASPGARVADVGDVEGHLLALLHDETLLAQPDLADVRGYLASAEGDRDALDRRRCQLAAQLAQLFEEYAASRPDMLSAWAEGKRGANSHPAASWQRVLWRAIFASGGRLEGSPHKSLETLWAAAMQRRPAPLAGQSVHVFGLSYVASGYHRMLAELARATELLIYTLAPCEEKESDLRAAPELFPEDPFRLHEEPRLALRLWARPGRESLRLLAGLPGAAVDSRFPAPASPPASLLERVQEHIVRRRAPGRRAPLQAPDDSLRVLPCPSLRRELEVVAAEIWALARRDPSLRLCDVAVIVPDASKDLYLTQLPSVFRESCQLPHNVVDLPASAGHRAVQAIEALLQLPFTSLSRKDVLAVLTHPCVMARFPEATAETWSSLAAELGIVRGGERGDFHPGYPARDVFSWDQGLRRLALGAFIDGAPGDDVAPVRVGEEAYLPGPPIAPDDQARLGFGLLARSLLADARWAWRAEQPPQRPLADWLAFVRGLIECYVVLDQDDGGGQALVAELLRRLDRLGDSGLGATPVSYRVLAELVRAELASLPWGSGRYLASGVTVSSFVPMRAIPFRAVFVLGLGQGAFPRPATRHELDLRQGARRVGDVDRREQDLYMFLETLLSARDKVVLSYVARDEITGEELPASSVLLELGAVLGQGILDGAGIEQWFCRDKGRRPPLRRHDESPERRSVLPAAEAEHRARALGEHLRPQPFLPTPVTESIAELPPSWRTSVERVLGLPRACEVGWETQNGPVQVSLTTLWRFLVDPLQASARFRLGMRDDDDDGAADLEDEPFDLGNRERTILLSDTMTAALVAAQAPPSWAEVKASFQRKALATELAGSSPSGIFREAESQRQEEALALWQSQLAEVLGRGPMRLARLRLGPGGGGAAHDGALAFSASPRISLPPSGQDGVAIEMDVVGQSRVCAYFPDASATSLAFTWRARATELELAREDMRAFLDYVVLTAAGDDDRRAGHRSALFHRSKGQAEVRVTRFAPLERARAQAYLAGLCRELLATAADPGAWGLHPYLLPHEAVVASHVHGTIVAHEIRNLCDAYKRKNTGFSSVLGPLPDVLERYPVPSDEEAARMIEARFGLLFELTRGQDA